VRTFEQGAANCGSEPKLPFFCSVANVGYPEIRTLIKVIDDWTVRHVVTTTGCHQMRQLIMQGLKLPLLFFDLFKPLGRDAFHFKTGAVLILIQAQKFAASFDTEPERPLSSNRCQRSSARF
jgi:hypothetical protein